MDLAARYAGTRAAVVRLVADLPAERELAPVPACPGWRVRDIVLHLVGVAEDGATGNLEGAPSDEWTARHLVRRAETPLADALADWDRHAKTLEDVLDEHPLKMPFVLDAMTHRHDLHGALGLPFPAATEFDRDSLVFAVESFGKLFGRRARDAGLPAVRLAHGDWSFVAGTAEPEVFVGVAPVEFFRALTGRRSVAQVCGWAWSDDPEPYLPFFSPFGDLAAADVVEGPRG